MQNRILFSWFISLMTLCSLNSRAETITHDFKTMTSSQVTYSSDNMTATTAEVTYQCYENAVFAVNLAASGTCAFLTHRYDSLKTLNAIEDLTLFYVYYCSASMLNENAIRIYVSTDGSTWENVTSSATFYSSRVDVDLPDRGTYYIKIRNRGIGGVIPFYITGFKYTKEHCNCFKVVNE